MQCVLQRFGTPGYKGLQKIEHFLFPIRTTDDDDDDRNFDDPRNIEDPPYPSGPRLVKEMLTAGATTAPSSYRGVETCGSAYLNPWRLLFLGSSEKNSIVMYLLPSY